MRARIAPIAALALISGCRGAETACFKVQSVRGTVKAPSGGETPRLFEAFVLANPPQDPETLRRSVEKQCGKQPAPDTPAYSVQWWIFRETRSTPRTLRVGTGKHDSLDAHQDDLILDLVIERGECGAFASDFLFKDGKMVSRETVPIEGAGASDAGPLPAWCTR